jgi:hypothetical protein
MHAAHCTVLHCAVTLRRQAPRDTARDVLSKVQLAVNATPTLTCGSVSLDDSRILAECGVTRGSVIAATPRELNRSEVEEARERCVHRMPTCGWPCVWAVWPWLRRYGCAALGVRARVRVLGCAVEWAETCVRTRLGERDMGTVCLVYNLSWIGGPTPCRLDELVELHLIALKETLGPKYIDREETRVQVGERAELIRGVEQRLENGDLPLKRYWVENFLTKLKYNLESLKVLALEWVQLFSRRSGCGCTSFGVGVAVLGCVHLASGWFGGSVWCGWILVDQPMRWGAQATLQRQEAEFDRALAEYHVEKRRAIRNTAIASQKKSEEYRVCLEAQDQTVLEVLNRTVERHVNVGSLEVGQLVQVVHEGRVVDAEVAGAPLGSDAVGLPTAGALPALRGSWGHDSEDGLGTSSAGSRSDSDPSVTVLLEFEELRNQFAYTKTFSSAVTLPRSQLYAASPLARQPAPGQSAIALATERGRDPLSDPVTTSDVE